MKDVTRENYAPRVYPLICLQKLSLPCYHYLIFIYFAIYNYQLSSTQFISLQVVSSRGLRTLLPALGASVCFFVCIRWRRGLRVTLIGLITMVLTEVNTYLYYDASPAPFRRKTQRLSQVSGRISMTVPREYHQLTIKYLHTNCHSVALLSTCLAMLSLSFPHKHKVEQAK